MHATREILFLIEMYVAFLIHLLFNCVQRNTMKI